MGMMGWMRRSSRYFLGAVVLTFIASLAYFGASGDRGPGQWMVTVDGEPVSVETYGRTYRALEEQYRQVFRERFSPELARSLKLHEQAVERLVSERLVQRQAAREGVRVSDRELAGEIMRIGAFQEGGQFSRDRYRLALRRASPPLTEAAFEAELRAELVRQRMQALIAGGVKVAEAEARQRWEAERQRIRAALLLVTPETALERVAVTDEELRAHLTANAATFARPERRRALVAILPGTSVPVPAVGEADVKEAYERRRAEFEQPPRVRLAHLVVRVPSTGGSAAEDQARGRAEAALQRIRGGAPFADVAREVSEDTATAPRGGEVGLVGQGELGPELDRVVFGLRRGEVAGPVRTAAGFHLVTVTEVVPGSKKKLEDVATTLRATLAAEGQLKALRDRAREAQAGLRQTADFAAEARRRGLTVREIGPLGRADAVEGIGRVQEASDALFALPAGSTSEPVKVPEGYAVFRLLETQPAQKPEDVKLDEVRAELTRAVRRQKALEAARATAGRLAEAWRKGEDPRALARREGATFSEVGPFSRAEPLGDRPLGQAIGPVAQTLPEGGVADPVTGPGGVYVVRVVSRERLDPAEFERARREVHDRLLQEKRSQAWQAWLQGLRAAAKVEVNDKIVPRS